MRRQRGRLLSRLRHEEHNKDDSHPVTRDNNDNNDATVKVSEDALVTFLQRKIYFQDKGELGSSSRLISAPYKNSDRLRSRTRARGAITDKIIIR